MSLDQYFQSLEDGNLNVTLPQIQLLEGTTQIGIGAGHLHLNSDGVFVLSAVIELSDGRRELPYYPPLQLIPVERDLAFRAETRDGHIVSASIGSVTSNSLFGDTRQSLVMKLPVVKVEAPVYGGTAGTKFVGLIDALPNVIFDRVSIIEDSNDFFCTSRWSTDWLAFETGHAKFVVRQLHKREFAHVRIESPYTGDEKIRTLPTSFLTGIGMRVGRMIRWHALAKRQHGKELITLYSKRVAGRPSGLLSELILKPAVNTLLVADVVQFLEDFPNSPLGGLQFAIWEADLQPTFVLKELALGVALEGISKFIVKHVSPSLTTDVSRQIGRDTAMLRVTRERFREAMAKQDAELRRQPYYNYLLNAVGNAKAYSAADYLKKAIELLTPSPIIGKEHVQAWARMRNSAAHARSSMIEQSRIDDYVASENMWITVVRSLVSSNPRTLSQTARHFYRPNKNDIAKQAYLNWELAGCPIGKDLAFWLKGEEQLVRASMHEAHTTQVPQYSQSLYAT